MSSAFTPKVVGAFNARNIGGDISGVAVPAGYIGEEIKTIVVSDTISVTADTEIDVTGSSITLTPGVWDLSYAAFAEINRPSGTIPVYGRVRVTDSSNVVESDTASAIGTQAPSGASLCWGTLNAAKRIVLSSSKTFKLRLTCSQTAASGTLTIYAGNGSGAITGNEGSTYIRAVRVA